MASSLSLRLASLPRPVKVWVERAAVRIGAPRGPGTSALAVWRARTLAAMLGVTLIIGMPPLILALWVFAASGLWQMMVADVAAYAAVAYVFFSRRLTFVVRAWTVITGLFAIGALTMFFSGFRTAGAVWLSLAAIAAGMLLGVRAGVLVVLANTALFVALGVGISQGGLHWAIDIPHAMQLWIMSAVNTAMLALVASVTVGVLLEGLEREGAARLRAEEERRVGRQLETLGTMAGGMAHDFNNLLAPILANVELLEGGATPEQQELLCDIRTSAERGRDLVRRLLTIRKGETREVVTADLGLVVHEVARLVRARASAGVDIEVAAPTRRVHGSCAELHQIVMNLATNAVQAMPEGGTLSLLVDDVRERGRAMTRLRVCDTGIGMAPETLERAFDPFFTTKSPQEGTGLGLPTVRAIVLSKGGRVDVASVRGGGTAVTVLLPTALTPAEESECSDASRDHGRTDGVQANDRKSPAIAAPHGAPIRDAVEERDGGTVLLVDDEPIVLETARRLLLALGYRPVAMTSAVEAEAWFARHAAECRLLLTDHRMPGRTGIALVAALRQMQPSLPAVVASGYVVEASAAARAQGITVSVLSKPYGLAELRTALEEALEAAGAEGDRRRSISNAAEPAVVAVRGT